MDGKVTLTIDDRRVSAHPDQTLWSLARRIGIEIPHLCHRDEPGYRPDGNCRACMVEIEGERVLTASCIRKVRPGMVVRTRSKRIETTRRMIFELLAADIGPPEHTPDEDSDFWTWARKCGIKDTSRLVTTVSNSEPVGSNPAIAVNFDACIACGLCVRACREVQVHDVLGMGWRGGKSSPVFDMHDQIGASTCVSCGECVQACPTGALLEKSLMDSASRCRLPGPFDRTTDSVCPFCGVGCQTRVSVKSGSIVRVDGRNGTSNENQLCVKGRFGYDYIASPDRLIRPLVRREGAAKVPLNDHIGSQFYEQFREASWDEALKIAASGFLRIKARSGSHALAGLGCAKGSNEEAYLFQRLIREGFGTNSVDHCTRLCHASSVAALLEGVGSGAVSAPFSAVLDADCIVIIGAKPAQNHPVAASYFKRAAKRGAKLIVIDPQGQGLMRFATHALRFTPGTDVALINALIHTIIEEDLYHAEFVASRVSGFAELKASVRAYSPEKMALVCGIDAATLREVARIFANSARSVIFWGMGISQHTHGTDNARCLISLALITGHIGRPGTGLHPLRGQNNVQGASDAGLIPMMFPDYIPVENKDARAYLEAVWNCSLDPSPGLTVVEMIDAIRASTLHGLYIMGENPAMSDPDLNHARSALQQLDHLVVQDIFPTETAWFADVILPASAHAEKTGTYTNTNRQIQLGRAVLPPPGDAKPDWKIILNLADHLGLNWSFQEVRDIYDDMTRVMPSLANISWDRLNAEDSITYPVSEPGGAGQDILFSDAFPTVDGKAKLVPADLRPPDEIPDENFPFVLTTGRLLEHWHTGSMTQRSATLHALEPTAIVAMNRSEISRCGFHPGQMVTVETRRGCVTAMLREDSHVADTMIFIPFCFPQSPANLLTNPKLDLFGKIPEYKYCAARVTATDGPPDSLP